jgi:Rrf2 family protein
MISKTAEYALRAMAHLGRNDGEYLTTRAIAEATRIPPSYLSKVLRSLVRAGIIAAQRGQGGGHTLARSPDRITILDIINAVDPIRRIDECPFDFDDRHDEFCLLHRRLNMATAKAEKELSRSMLSEHLGRPRGRPPSCVLGHTRRRIRRKAKRRRRR